MLARLHDLVVPVGALDQAHRERRRALAGARPVEHAVELLRRLAQVGLQHQPDRGAVAELGLVEQLEHQLLGGLERVHRLHVHVQVRAQLLGAAQQRAQPRGGVVAAHLRRLGPHQRRERGHLHRQVHARDRAGGVALEQRPLGPARRRPGQRAKGLVAARGVAVGLLLAGHGGLAEQVERGADAVAPLALDHAKRRARRLADDEAVGHVPHAGRGRGAERAATRARARHAHGGGQRRRLLLDLLQVADQVPRQVVERAAGRGHVDEAEERGAQLLVAVGELHRLRVERAQRVPGGGRERAGQCVTHSPDFVLEHAKRIGCLRCPPRSCSGRCCASSASARRCSGSRPTGPARSRCSARASAPSACTATTTRSCTRRASSPARATSTSCSWTVSAPGRSRTPCSRRAASAPTRRSGRSRSCSAPAA